MSGQPILNIRDFDPADLAQVHDLFAKGLMEFAGEVEEGVRRYVNHALQDDLADIPTQYQSHPRGNFWVAESSGLVTGIVGIQPTENEEEAELRRMSVSSLARRQGIGRRLMETTEDFCREKGYQRILLSTVDILQPALAMYRGNGYTTVKVEPYGVPPHQTLNVHYLTKDLY
jgi:ribosomal protein S18 acetylase RimI-like enzyme